MFTINTKKGIEAGVLVAIIITIVSFVLIAGTLMRFMSTADEKEIELMCSDSLVLRARSAFNIDSSLVKSQLKTVPVLCKTIDKKIKGNREEIMEQVAQKIARCWWMFGEGKYEEILSSSTIDLLPSLLGVDNQPNGCFNCYNLMIDQDEIEGGPIDYSEFLDYLWTHSPSNVNGSVNYIQYIQGYGGPGMFVNIIDGSIKPRHAYAISVLPKNIEKEKTNWVKWGGVALMSGATLAAVTCTVITGGLCAPALLTVTAGLGGGLTARGLAYELAKGKYASQQEIPSAPGNYDYGTQIAIKDMFKEREYTSIYLSEADYGQKFCGSGDLAGE